jgi:hypothetical protein
MGSNTEKAQDPTNQNSDSKDANHAEDALKEEVEHSKRKVHGLLSVGRNWLENSIDLDEATKHYEDGIRNWHSNELSEAYCDFDLSEHALRKAQKKSGLIGRFFLEQLRIHIYLLSYHYRSLYFIYIYYFLTMKISHF